SRTADRLPWRAEWWLWRGVRRALGQLPARPARSWTLGGKDNFVADQAVAGQVAAAQARVSGPGPCLACPQAALLLASLPTRRGPVWCEGQALPADGAAGADGLRPRDLIQGRTRRREGKNS